MQLLCHHLVGRMLNYGSLGQTKRHYCDLINTFIAWCLLPGANILIEEYSWNTSNQSLYFVYQSPHWYLLHIYDSKIRSPHFIQLNILNKAIFVLSKHFFDWLFCKDLGYQAFLQNLFKRISTVYYSKKYMD